MMLTTALEVGTEFNFFKSQKLKVKVLKMSWRDSAAVLSLNFFESLLS